MSTEGGAPSDSGVGGAGGVEVPPPVTVAAAAVTSPPPTPGRAPFIPLVTVVGFHHARGPEVETWFGVPEGSDPAVEYDWGLLPFMALSDGAHAASEDFSYFTLLRPATAQQPATSLFGISCTSQLDASQLLNRPSDVTRSTVQKAVVVIADNPQSFGMLRERLSVVTQAWFAQREFTDVEILRRFQESLAEEKMRGGLGGEIADDKDQYLGMSLREFVHEFKWQTLVLLKCCLLQPKMLFFGSRCERLCMMQFSLISLIPGLIRNLQDCADPELNNYEKTLVKPTSMRSSDRRSLLSYMGLPLQIFGKGALFGPYTPLQQLDVLADFGTKSYIVGSTNSLLLQQRDRYSDILINLDDNTINITSTSLRSALTLSVSDRRWIDYLTQEVNDTWDEKNPSRPKTMGYVGSEEFIRVQFEEYILSLIASVKYHNHIATNPNSPGSAGGALLPHIEGDPSADFGSEWVDAWARTENYRIWNAHTDPDLYFFVEPRHPCAGGLTIEDVQRRISQQVQELHLDERFAQGREVLGRNLAAGREKASFVLNKIYSDVEAMRESQRRRTEESRAAQQPLYGTGDGNGAPGSGNAAGFGNVDLAKAQQTMQSVGLKAGAYMSSWATWAGEKRKAAGWGAKPATAASSSTTNASGGTLGGWGFGRTKSNTAENNGLIPTKPAEGEYRMVGGGAGSRLSGSSAASDEYTDRTSAYGRPLTQGSMTGSVVSVETPSAPGSPGKQQYQRPQSGGSGIDQVVSGEKLAFYRDEVPTTASAPPAHVGEKVEKTTEDAGSSNKTAAATAVSAGEEKDMDKEKDVAKPLT